MNSNRNRLIIIIAICAAVVTIAAVVIGLIATGVFGGQQNSDIDKLTQSMDSLLNRNQDQKSSGMLIAVDEMPADDIEQMIRDTVEYRILSAKDGTVVLEIKAVDMQAVVNDVSCQLDANGYQVSDFSKAKEDASAYFKSAIQANENNKITTKVEVEYIQQGTEYAIVETEAFYNAVHGGVLDVFADTVEELEQ